MCSRSILCILLLFAASKSALRAQDNLDDLKAEWRSGKYQTVLQPLIAYRDSARGGADFEVDYMIGTSMCHWPDFKANGCDYLRSMRNMYPSPRFDGRPVNLRQVTQSNCGPDPVSAATDESAVAGVDAKVDRASSARTKSAADIRNEIKQNLSMALELNMDRAGQDYRDFDLNEARVDLCRDACANDSGCRAFTYVRPSYQGANARCWLKSGIPKAAANDCCISGVK